LLLVVGGLSKFPLLTTASSLATSSYAGDVDAAPISSRPVTRLVIHRSLYQVWAYKDDIMVKAYPVAVGRSGWETPTGDYQVRQLIQNPVWVNPITGEEIAAGSPKNPLGHYWIGFWTDGDKWIGLHGTPDPKSIGKADSHGCIRMYSQDVEELFHQVQVGTTVSVVP
jgi:lipoprotein-anchoring transpeptidase ErfK/SrfK